MSTRTTIPSSWNGDDDIKPPLVEATVPFRTRRMTNYKNLGSGNRWLVHDCPGVGVIFVGKHAYWVFIRLFRGAVAL